MTAKGLVTIGVPIYNEEGGIRQCIQTIVDDPYPYKEVIVADNCSTDTTWRIVQECKKEFAGVCEITTVRHEANKGALYNFTYLLSKASGEYFIWVGGHDKWGMNFLPKCVEVLESDTSIVLVMPTVFWVDNADEVVNFPHATLDTTGGVWPVERVHMFLQRRIQCTAIYGLHRTEVLQWATPRPTSLSWDRITLARIARRGHIVSTDGTAYFRRVRERESREEMIRRQVYALQIKGVARWMPQTVAMARLWWQSMSAEGPVRNRLKLSVMMTRQLASTALFERAPWVLRAKEKVKLTLAAKR